MSDIPRIDTHQHFWRYSAAEYGWMHDAMAALRRDFLPADLAPLLAAANLDGSVAVQARQTLEETRWLCELADGFPSIQGVVGWVDLQSPEAGEQLAAVTSHPRLRGIRHIVHDEPDDRFMLREDFLRGLGLLADFGMTYDLLLFPKHLPVACAVVEKFPNQPFVLDHIAKPLIKDGVLEPWATDLRRLAVFPNVWCKVSGMVTEADWAGWQADDFRRYLDVVVETFGVERLMVGSDWPVCTVAGAYARVMDIPAAYFAQFSPEEQAAVWGGNACRFYGIGKN